jgi:hypothetical protein
VPLLRRMHHLAATRRGAESSPQNPPSEPSDDGPDGIEHQVVHIESAIWHSHHERNSELTELDAQRHSESGQQRWGESTEPLPHNRKAEPQESKDEEVADQLTEPPLQSGRQLWTDRPKPGWPKISIRTDRQRLRQSECHQGSGPGRTESRRRAPPTLFAQANSWPCLGARDDRDSDHRYNQSGEGDE